MTTVYIETAGCSQNFADSEQMAGLLKQAKFEVVKELEPADMVIFNTCTIKGPTEAAFFRRLEEVKEKWPYKIIIIAGCIAQIDSELVKKYPLLGTKQIHRVVEIVEEALHENKIKLLETKEQPPLNLPRLRKNPVIGIIPICRGCLGSCTFCKTKLARGNLISYSIEEIKKEVEQALKEGVQELWLTGQDLGCYGFDLNPKTNLPALLQELIKLPFSFKLRLGMMNPNHLLKIKNELIPLLKDPKVFRFLHLPVQSGNNQILKAMGREYTKEEFLALVQELKQEISPLTIATDIMVGFSGETEEQHWDTLNLLNSITPDVINISRFWPRPKTPAAAFERLSGALVKQRFRVITEMHHNISRILNERWQGWEGFIIIDEKGKEPQQWIGRNFTYKPVIIEGDYKLGQIVKVKILKASSFDLRGEVRE